MANAPHPSSGPSDHLLPQGEKESGALRPAGEAFRTQNTKRLRVFAKSMRRQPTDAERKMWMLLRDRRLTNHKFRRQVPIGPYIADFVCNAAKLVIELDGTQHAGSARDAVRDGFLAGKGFRILRIWNNDILARPQQVLEAVWVEVEKR